MGNRTQRGQITINHFHFQQVIKRQQGNKEVIIVRKPILHESQYKNWKEIYDRVRDMGNKDSLFLPLNLDFRALSTSVLQCNCCGAAFQIQLTYYNFNYVLYSQLVSRIKSKRYFSQQELIQLLYKMLVGSKQFQLKSLFLGDIRPKNIIVLENAGDIGMINLASYPWQKTSMDKVLDDNDQATVFYFAPQQIEFLNSKQQRGAYPNAKTQAFSIGLTILQAATLQSSESLYIQKRKQFDTRAHQERMNEVRSRYHTLHGYLEKISKIQPKERFSSGEAWACLDIYSEKICGLQKFNVNENQQRQSLNRFRRDIKK